MTFIKGLIVFFIVFILGLKTHAAVFSFEAEPDTGTATFPAGTMFRTTLQNTVSSKESKPGDKIELLLISDVIVGKSVCIPKNSLFLGEVVDVVPAQEGRDGYFRVAVRELVYIDGWRTPISASIWDNNQTDIIGGGVSQMTEYKKVPHYIENIGNIVQLVQSGPRAMGKEIALPAGKEVIVVLNRDLSVKYLEKM